MKNEIEQKLAAWYERMVNGPGLFDSEREAGVADLTPQDRLQELFLKRLEGFQIHLAVTDTQEFGNLVIDDRRYAIQFNIQELRANGMTSVLPFTSDRGHTGHVKLDWKHSTFVVVPDEGEPVTYVVNEYLQYVSEYDAGYTFKLGFLLVLAPLLDDTAAERDFLRNLSLNRYYIEGLLLSERTVPNDGMFRPNALTTFKEMAEITGVQPSTFSNIRNGKKSIDNLTWKTLAILSFYAQIRILDAHIIDMLRTQLSGGVLRGSEPTRADDVLKGVVVRLRDDSSYWVHGDTEELLYKVFEELTDEYNSETRSLVLPLATHADGETYERVLIPKGDVATIRIEDIKV